MQCIGLVETKWSSYQWCPSKTLQLHMQLCSSYFIMVPGFPHQASFAKKIWKKQDEFFQTIQILNSGLWVPKLINNSEVFHSDKNLKIIKCIYKWRGEFNCTQCFIISKYFGERTYMKNTPSASFLVFPILSCLAH